jgi:hypothetical protein
MRPLLSISLRHRLGLPHPVLRRAPTYGTVGLCNPASCRPEQVRGNQVFGERLRATTGNTISSDNEFPNDDFFPIIDDLFGNLNMGANTDVVVVAANSVAAAANPAPYVFLPFLF